MAYSAEQIEKHTLVTRLSVSIYKMNDDELSKLLTLMLQENRQDLDAFNAKMSISSAAQDLNVRRQIIIAQLFIVLKKLDKDTILEHLRVFGHPEFKWIREYPRLNCYMLVDFAIESKAYRGVIRDISAGGVFIETSEPFEIEQEIDLCFTLLESNENLPLKIKGKVARVYPDGIGIMYKNITNYQREIINALLQKISSC